MAKQIPIRICIEMLRFLLHERTNIETSREALDPAALDEMVLLSSIPDRKRKTKKKYGSMGVPYIYIHIYAYTAQCVHIYIYTHSNPPHK